MPINFSTATPARHHLKQNNLLGTGTDTQDLRCGTDALEAPHGSKITDEEFVQPAPQIRHHRVRLDRHIGERSQAPIIVIGPT